MIYIPTDSELELLFCLALMNCDLPQIDIFAKSPIIRTRMIASVLKTYNEYKDDAASVLDSIDGGHRVEDCKIPARALQPKCTCTNIKAGVDFDCPVHGR